MKRIILLGLIGFILSGCGDDKVTNEYLVGKWDCKNDQYKSKYDSKLKEYDDYSLESSEQFKLTFKIVDGILMAKINNEKAGKFDLDEAYSNLSLEGKINLGEVYSNLSPEEKTNNCSYSIKRELVKKTSNKFSWTEETFFDCINDKDLVSKFKTKIERIFTRIE